MTPALIILTAVSWLAAGLLVARAMGRATDAGALDAPIWHPHTDQPEELTTAIIAIPDAEDADDEMPHRLLPGIYFMRGGQWRDELSDTHVKHAVYWWASESDLMALLPADAREGATR